MKVYKIKFDDKENKRDFSRIFGDDEAVIDTSKKKSIIVEAKNAGVVEHMISKARRHHGVHFEAISIKKISNDAEEYQEEER